MIKFYKLAFLFVIISLPVFSETAELEVMDSLILSTKTSVAIQEKIRAQLIAYQKINKDFLKNPNDAELLFQTIKSADLLFRNIQEAHLSQNFSAEFLNELTLFSQIASKKGNLKP